MRTEKAVSEATLQRLWSEISLLRKEVEQAERKRKAARLALTSAVAAARARLQPHLGRYR